MKTKTKNDNTDQVKLQFHRGNPDSYSLKKSAKDHDLNKHKKSGAPLDAGADMNKEEEIEAEKSEEPTDEEKERERDRSFEEEDENQNLERTRF